ncbi:MAG: hypothetical protein ACOC2L_00995, partial [Candidatus Sumerlaeota bacterium]
YYALMAAGADLGMDLDNIQRACELVNIAPGSLTAQYDISYYDRFNPTLQPTIANGNITISDPTARGTLVIRKKAGKEPYADIRSIVIAGSLQTLYSEANIGRLVVDGEVGRYLGADSYTRSIEVGGQIRAIRMDGRENSYSLDERLFATSNNSDPTTGMAAYRSYLDYSNPHIAVSINSNLNGEPARKFPLSIQAKGLGLTNIYAPYQPLRHFSLSAKLWDTGRGYQDISNSALFSTSTAQQFATYPAVAPFGQVNVANMKTMLAYGSQMNPEFITANRIPARRSRLVSRGMMFTPDYFGEAGHVFQFSEFTPDFVYMNSVNTSFHASAGDISPYRLFVTGQISNLSARMQFYRKYYYVPSGSQNGVPSYRLTSATHAYGGAVGDIPDFKGGSLDYNIYAAGMNNMYPAHIRNIVGTEYVSGIFICGVDYVTNDGTVVPDSRGRILRIGTNNDRLESAQFSIQFTDDPEIGGSVLGRAYVAGPIRRIVGDDTYFQVFDY